MLERGRREGAVGVESSTICHGVFHSSWAPSILRNRATLRPRIQLVQVQSFKPSFALRPVPPEQQSDSRSHLALVVAHSRASRGSAIASEPHWGDRHAGRLRPFCGRFCPLLLKPVNQNAHFVTQKVLFLLKKAWRAKQSRNDIRISTEDDIR